MPTPAERPWINRWPGLIFLVGTVAVVGLSILLMLNGPWGQFFAIGLLMVWFGALVRLSPPSPAPDVEPLKPPRWVRPLVIVFGGFAVALAAYGFWRTRDGGELNLTLFGLALACWAASEAIDLIGRWLAKRAAKTKS
jgi:hypothetical protein